MDPGMYRIDASASHIVVPYLRVHLPQEGPQVQQHIASELHRNQERVADGSLKPYKMDQQMFTAALMKYKESPIVQQTMEACQQRQAQLFAGLGMTG